MTGADCSKERQELLSAIILSAEKRCGLMNAPQLD
jgi:hypothetical protein